MTRTKSALKAQRASLRKRARNLSQTNQLDKLLRSIKRAPSVTVEAKQELQQALDKAGKTGLMHHRRAARLKSRLLRERTTQSTQKSVTSSKKKARKTKKKSA